MTPTLLALLFACGGDKISDGDDLENDTDIWLDESTGVDDDTGVDDTAPPTGTTDTGPFDLDGDGYAGAADCDDSDPDINPAADEACDDVDNDCDYDIDEGVTTTSWADLDFDGYGDPDNSFEFCDLPSGNVDNEDDCDDTNGEVNPDAEEICDDGLDNDCDGFPATDCGLETDISLADADVLLIGEGDNDQAGHDLDAAGDVDGDGADDLIVGAYFRDTGSGGAYLFYGPITADASMADADAFIPGEGDYLGYRVAGPGDVNGDGLDDVLVTRPGATGASRTEVLLFQGPLLGDTATDSAEARLIAAGPSDYTGFAIGSGDVNADGYRDVLLGGSGVFSDAGAIYLFTGPISGDLPVDTNADAVIFGANSGDLLGYNGVPAVDLDGDGADDIVGGAPAAELDGIDGGGVFIFHGLTSGNYTTADADVTISAYTHDDQLGWQVVPAGDVNGDGAQDLLVSASANDLGGTNAGAAYLFHGPLKAGAMTVADAAATFIGAAANDLLGDHLSGAGDLNGDSYDDLLISALGNDSAAAEAGATWLLYGPTAGTTDLATDASTTFTGVALNDASGSLPERTADLNDDGLDDMFAGSFGADNDGLTNNGAVYLIFGVEAGF